MPTDFFFFLPHCCMHFVKKNSPNLKSGLKPLSSAVLNGCNPALEVVWCCRMLEARRVTGPKDSLCLPRDWVLSELCHPVFLLKEHSYLLQEGPLLSWNIFLPLGQQVMRTLLCRIALHSNCIYQKKKNKNTRYLLIHVKSWKTKSS